MRYIQHILCLLLFIQLCAPIKAQDVRELQQQQEQLQRQLKETEKMLGQTKKNEKATVNKLNLLNNNIRDRKKLIQSINKEIGALDRDISNLDTQNKQLQKQLEQHKADYARLVRQTHYADLNASPLLFLCSAEDFQQLIRRIHYMSRFMQYRQRQVEEIRTTQNDIARQNEQLSQRRKDQTTALKKQQREQDQLKRDERKQKRMLEDLKKQKKQLLAQQQKQQKKADQLNKKIEELIRQQTQSKTTLTREQQLLAGGFEANKGRLPWPVEKGYISGLFGTHKHPVYEHVTVNNKGIYIQTVAGSDARAVFDGEVSSCLVLGATYAVIVQHGNYRSVYSNLSKVYVKQGDKVKGKQALGRILSDTDDDNKTELYFQIYQDRNLLNPSLWITQ